MLIAYIKTLDYISCHYCKSLYQKTLTIQKGRSDELLVNDSLSGTPVHGLIQSLDKRDHWSEDYPFLIQIRICATGSRI